MKQLIENRLSGKKCTFTHEYFVLVVLNKLTQNGRLTPPSFFRHYFPRTTIDWKLYKLESPRYDLSSAPNIALQYGVLYGTLKNVSAHQSIDIMVPSKGYHEAGLLLNNLIRLRFSSYYQTFNIGYFYHLNATGPVDFERKGKIVIGASIEL